MPSAHHPESGGQTERFNQSFETYIRCFCKYDQDLYYSMPSDAVTEPNWDVPATARIEARMEDVQKRLYH
ncbi:hypothetical protein SeLEV6574_g04866 [Synchytrium endobioticum]|uniref:Integrase catalytic domain-containing protein n=1 Tax=Synchytrium endobioticum TaxID=286115 RepID=A0A507CX20_9FUNG|nr:hypothetical protein SeLEV6574_g04866 [Synchytrium endobioticum]